MQPSLGILPVYCYSTSGVYHTHMHTPTRLHTHTHTHTAGEGGSVCVRERERERKRDRKKRQSFVVCHWSLLACTNMSHVAMACFVKSHKYAALIPWPCLLCAARHPTTLGPEKKGWLMLLHSAVWHVWKWTCGLSTCVERKSGRREFQRGLKK